MLIAVGTGSGNGSGSVGPHSHVAADVTDFNEAVDDRVATLLQAGSNVSLDYDDANGTLTLASTGGGLFTSVSDKAADHTATGADDKTLLNFTAVATLTLPPAASLPDGWTIGVRNVSGGSVVLQPSGSETVNDAASLQLASGRGVLLTKVAGGFVTLDGSALSPVAFIEPPVSYGYLAGGETDIITGSRIERFALGSSSNSAAVGDLVQSRKYASGLPDVQGGNGYVCGGAATSGSPVLSSIERFSFASAANGVGVGDLTVARQVAAGVADGQGYGYVAGGTTMLETHDYYVGSTTAIDRFPLTSSTVAVDLSDLTVERNGVAGSPDYNSQYGYWMGGISGNAVITATIDRTGFAASTSTAAVGDLTVARRCAAGHHDSTNGYAYVSGGDTASHSTGMVNIIDRFAFSSAVNVADVGDLTVTRLLIVGGASDSADGYGYSAGGYEGPGRSDVIDRFAYASNGNAADVGDMTAARTVCGMEG